MARTINFSKDKTAKQEAIYTLRDDPDGHNIVPGTTLYTVLRHRSSSGMLRIIDVILMKHDEPRFLGYNVARLLGDTFDREREGVRVGGCGMDMGFHLVYNVSRVLFPDGFGVEGTLGSHTIRPRTQDEAADYVRQGAVFFGRNGDKSGWDNDGGYALRHRWL